MNIDPIKFFLKVDRVYYKRQNPKSKIKEFKKTVSSAEDIAYKDKKNCSFDMYYNDSAKVVPAIVYIHGGGFVAGDKKYREAYSLFLSNYTGARVFSLNYGLSPENTFFETTKDINDAINFIVSKSEEYCIDKNKVIVIGDSSGACFSSYIGAISKRKDIEEYLNIKCNYIVDSLVLMSGLYDMDLVMNGGDSNMVNKIFNFLFKTTKENIKDEEFYKYANPIDLIDEKFPNSLLIYSRKDMFVKGQGERLSEVLKEKNIEFSEYVAKRFYDNHDFNLNNKTRAAKNANKRVIEYINQRVTCSHNLIMNDLK